MAKKTKVKVKQPTAPMIGPLGTARRGNTGAKGGGMGGSYGGGMGRGSRGKANGAN